MRIHFCLWGIIIGFSVITLFAGCNITYKVRNQFNDIEHTLHVPCGKVTIELIGRGNSKFMLRQRFNVDEKVVLFPDSLRVYYNDKKIEIDQNFRKNEKRIEISENKTLDVSFKFESGVFEGDTIIIYGNDYMNCNGIVIPLDTMIYSFVNTFRIAGVNDI